MMTKRSALWIVPALLAVFYLPVELDANIYYSVANSKSSCCSFVSESRLARPVTYAMVDEWTEPVWGQNAAGTERWLTSYGMVNGVAKFWRIVERQPITDGAESKI